MRGEKIKESEDDLPIGIAGDERQPRVSGDEDVKGQIKINWAELDVLRSVMS